MISQARICTFHRTISASFKRIKADILSKWFLLALGPQHMHKMLDGFEDKSIQAVCTFAYSEGPGHEPIIFQGRTDVRATRGLPRESRLTIYPGQARTFKRPYSLWSVPTPAR